MSDSTPAGLVTASGRNADRSEVGSAGQSPSSFQSALSRDRVVGDVESRRDDLLGEATGTTTLPVRAPLARGRLGHYEVSDTLGSGGMGVVYRARDTRLGREVALKVLAPDAAADPNRWARFEREAKVLAELDHPGIVTIHSLEDEDGIRFLTMELVDGRTLKELVRPEGITLGALLSIAIPLAGALAAAHDKGIVHRDLKPGNVMVTGTGMVKVLDFGLARHSFANRDADRGDRAKTLESSSSDGKLVGTLFYMAPEQLRGRGADCRSDVFSLGAILHELATGERPFRGTTPAAVISSILRETPPCVTQLNGSLPRELDGIVLRCLEKDPSRRYPTAQGLRDDLLELARGIPSLRLEASSMTGVATTGRHAPFRRRVRSRVLLLAVGVVLLPQLFERAPRQTSGAPRDTTMVSLVAWPSNETESRISPPGDWISFISDRDGRAGLWLTRIEGVEPRRSWSRPGHILTHAWSPDGDEICYIVAAPEGVFLQTVKAFGGAPERSFRLEPRFGNAARLQWTGSSPTVEVVRAGLFRFDLVAGAAAQLLPPTIAGGLATEFAVSRDGDQVAFVHFEKGSPELWWADLATGRAVPLAPRGMDARHPLWMGPEDRHVLFASSSGGAQDLWQLTLDGRTLRRITFGSEFEIPQDAAADGSAVTFQVFREQSHLWRLDVASRRNLQLTAGSFQHVWPNAGGGRRLAFQEARPMDASGAGVFDSVLMVGELGTELLAGVEPLGPRGAAPSVSPSGAHLAYVRSVENRFELWLYDFAARHSWLVADRIAPSMMYLDWIEWTHTNVAWSPTGSSLYFVELTAIGLPRLDALEVSPGSAEPRVLVAASPAAIALDDLHPSGDDRWLAYVRTTKDGTQEVRIGDLATGDDSVVLRQAAEPADALYVGGWLAGSAEIVVLRGRHSPDSSERLEILAVGRDGDIRVVGEVDRAYGGGARIDPRGRWLYITKVDDAASAQNIYRLRLEDGRVERLTENMVQGVGLANLVPLADGTLVYSRQESNSDLALIRFPM